MKARNRSPKNNNGRGKRKLVTHEDDGSVATTALTTSRKKTRSRAEQTQQEFTDSIPVYPTLATAGRMTKGSTDVKSKLCAWGQCKLNEDMSDVIVNVVSFHVLKSTQKLKHMTDPT